MPGELDEFLFRRFIPEENRGGTYHAVIIENGELSGPMPPHAATQRGFPLPAIHAAINASAIAELHAEREKTQNLTAEINSMKNEMEETVRAANEAIASANMLAGRARSVIEVAAAPVEEIKPSKPILNFLTMGLMGR